MKKYIISNPEILGGMPVIAGTRVPIARILYLLKEGYSLKEIKKHFPHGPLKTLEKVLEELAAPFDTSYHATKIL